MPPDAPVPPARRAPWIEHAALLLGACFVLLFLGIALARLVYPFEATWMESAMQQMMAQRLEGRSMYGEPSLAYMPCLYPPLYFDVAASLGRIFASGSALMFWPLRFVSLFASLATTATVVVLLRRKGQRWSMAIAWASVFLATYGRFEGWHDASRVDALLTLLVLLTATFLIEGRSTASAVAAGLTGAAAVLTKQPAAVWLALSLVGIVATRRQHKRAAVIAFVGASSVVAYLSATGDLTNPWLRYWTFDVPASHRLVPGFLVRGVTFVLVTFPIAALLGASALVFRIRDRRTFPGLSNVPPWSATLVTWSIAAVALRCKEGASINFFLPLVPVALVAVGEALRVSDRRGHLLPRARVAVLCLAQLAMLVYDPRPFVPTDADAASVAALIERLRVQDGPVFVPAFPSYAAAAGKPWFVHEAALVDTRATSPLVAHRDLPAAIGDGRFAALLLDPAQPLVEHEILRTRYVPTSLSLPSSRFLRALHAGHLEPVLWLRRP